MVDAVAPNAMIATEVEKNRSPAAAQSSSDISLEDRKRNHDALSGHCAVSDSESSDPSSATADPPTIEEATTPGKPAVISTLQSPSSSGRGSSGPPAQRKRRVSTDSEVMNIPQANPIVRCITKPGKTTKKPQLKYDPDVPMTKEEAAVWRREQRRKRNRESAAASRQRQRDRITELEAEVEQWKVKYDRIMRQVRELEHMTGSRRSSSPAVMTARDIYHRRGAPPPHTMQQMMMRRTPKHGHMPHPHTHGYPHHHAGTTTPTYHPPKTAATAVVTPPVAAHPTITAGREEPMYHPPRHHPSVSPYASPQEESSSDEHEEHVIEYHKTGTSGQEYQRHHRHHQHSSKISSRPAVKITDADADNVAVSTPPPSFPGLPSSDSLLPPDLCISENNSSKLEPMDQALLEEAADAVLSATDSREDDEDAVASVTGGPPHEDFGEFLLDAVDWL